jgi:hypothetical protein
MKTFQKITLAAAISAAPFMSQAMEAVDDSVLASTTGQAGVTIEIELGTGGIDIGSVVYVDTAHEVEDVNGVAPDDAGYITTTADGGSVTLENINVSLTGTITQTIDVSAAGDLVMETSAPGSVAITMGASATETDFSALKLGGTNGDSEVINNLDLAVTLGASTTTIMSLGTGSSGLGALGNAGVDDTTNNAYSTDVSSMAIKMSTTVEVTDMNVGMFGYTRDQADALSVAGGGAAGDATSDFYADNSAIKISGVTVKNTAENIANGEGSAMSMDQVIWAQGGTVAQGGGVYMQMGDIEADISITGIEIGGASIGSVAINGLEMAGMTQRIYGH